jgi:hypothetical protein
MNTHVFSGNLKSVKVSAKVNDYNVYRYWTNCIRECDSDPGLLTGSWQRGNEPSRSTKRDYFYQYINSNLSENVMEVDIRYFVE